MSQFDEYVRAGADDHAERLDAIYDALVDISPMGSEAEIFRSLCHIYMRTDGDMEAIDDFFAEVKELRNQREAYEAAREEITTERTEELYKERLDNFREEYTNEDGEYLGDDFYSDMIEDLKEEVDQAIVEADDEIEEAALKQIEVEGFDGEIGQASDLFALHKVVDQFKHFYDDRVEARKDFIQKRIEEIQKDQIDAINKAIDDIYKELKATDWEAEAYLKAPEKIEELDRLRGEAERGLKKCHNTLDKLDELSSVGSLDDLKALKAAADKKAKSVNRRETILANKIKKKLCEKYWASDEGQKKKASIRAKAAWSAFRVRQHANPNGDVRPHKQDYEVAATVVNKITSDYKSIVFQDKKASLRTDKVAHAKMTAARLVCNEYGVKKIPIKKIASRKKQTEKALQERRQKQIELAPILRKQTDEELKKRREQQKKIADKSREEDKESHKQKQIGQQQAKQQRTEEQSEIVDQAKKAKAQQQKLRSERDETEKKKTQQQPKPKKEDKTSSKDKKKKDDPDIID